MNEVDKCLKRLAIEAQRHPPKSQQRQRALAKLVCAIQQSGKLTRPYKGYFRGFYEEIYTEALQKLFCHICEKLDDYDPEREVLQWANFLLKKRFFIEAIRTIMPSIYEGIDNKRIRKITIDDLDRNNPVEINPHPSLSQEVIQCLEDDPEGLFKGTYAANNPDANFQFIAMKIVSGYAWKEISVELGMKVPTLSSFYQRCLTKFAPKFKEYLS